MIENINERLVSMVKNVLPEAIVSFDVPDNAEKDPIIYLYLLNIVPAPPLRGGNGRPPLQLSLRYLVTTSLAGPEKVHHNIEQVIFAAMEEKDIEVELEVPSIELWRAFGTKPRPSFFLSVPLRKERPELPIEYVRQEIEVKIGSVTSLRGIVFGPGHVPVANARIELPFLNVSEYTDSKGYFRFAAVPREPETKALRIFARNQEFNVTVNHPLSESDLIEITLDTLINYSEVKP